jgi:hypothetical protein
VKYVRCLHRGLFLFPDKVRHDKMKELLGGQIISAGFVGRKDGKLSCYGQSTTLRLASLPDDTELLNDQGLL